ncbi:MAG: 3-hydroxyacyl-CoA dehydrogenase NAD-binding domain-containing protein, partial [Jatrophihabitantaceae bacterium]
MTQQVAVIGAGLMGSGIAQVSAVAGLPVVLQDITDVALQRGKDGIEKSLTKFAQKGKLTETDVQAALDRITTSTELGAAADADLVVEAVFESLDVKQGLFQTLDGLCKDGAVL